VILAVTIVVVIVLMAIRVPLFLAISLPPAIALVVIIGLDPTTVGERLVDALSNVILLAIPLYLLMGYLLAEGQVGVIIMDTFGAFLRHLPGGLGIVTVVGAIFFAGVTGSTAAELAALSMITVPSMVEAGYERKFALSLLATAATLGSIFPPSIPMILYAYLANVSVGKLFIAGILPGSLMAAALAGYTAIVVRRRGWGRGVQPATSSERWKALWRGIPVLVLPLLILVAIYRGVATPTEVGAIAVIYTVFLGAVVYRSLTFAGFVRACRQTVRLTSVVLLILAGSSVLGLFLSFQRVPQDLTEWVSNRGVTGLLLIVALVLVLLVLGFFLEPPPILFLTVPVFLPTLLFQHVNLIYFGIVMMVTLQLAQVHPPVGASLLVLSAMYKIDPMRMVYAILPFIILMLAILAIVVIWPPLSLALAR
jgi:C4-dicarboxylate transporter DctM subunit